MKLTLLAIVLLLTLTNGCNSASMKPEVRILKKIDISKDWSTIKPSPPIETCKEVQYIAASVQDVHKWNIDAKNNQFIKPNGSYLKLDIKLVDEEGEEYILNEPSLGKGGLSLSYLPQNIENGIGLPKGKKFTSVILRASSDIKQSQITWRCIQNY